jgi:hypothetical protein
LRTGHADRAAFKWLGGKFRLNIRKIGFAHSGTSRIARLRHEPVDDPVEDEAIIEAALRQCLNLGHMFGREIGPEQDRDTSVLGVEIERVLEVLRRSGGKPIRKRSKPEGQAQGKTQA